MPVPRTRSSRTSCGECDRELRVQRGTGIIELLVVLGFRSSYLSLPRVLTNFGIGPLAPLRGSLLSARAGPAGAKNNDAAALTTRFVVSPSDSWLGKHDQVRIFLTHSILHKLAVLDEAVGILSEPRYVREAPTQWVGASILAARTCAQSKKAGGATKHSAGAFRMEPPKRPHTLDVCAQRVEASLRLPGGMIRRGGGRRPFWRGDAT